MTDRDKELYLPEAYAAPGGVWDLEEPDEEPAPDPLDRPDLVPLEEEEPDDGSLLFDPMGGETEPCPCCGADIPANPSWGYICPKCWWEMDDDVAGDPLRSSDLNHGLSLEEAQMNFRAFGISNPALRWE